LKKAVLVEEAEALQRKEEADKEAERLRQEAIERGETPDQNQEGCNVQ
jgi:hypothetical protein